MYSEAFFQNLLERTPQVGLPVILSFSSMAPAREAMARILTLERQKILVVDTADRLIVLAVQTDGRFGSRENRKIRVLLKAHQSLPFALGQLAEWLDQIEARCRHQDLSPLQTNRAKKRSEVGERIMETWLSSEVKQTLADWSLTLEHEALPDDQFTMLELRLKLGEDLLSCYRLDAWSGYLKHNERWCLEHPTTADHLNRTILQDIEHYLEQATQTTAQQA